jgi:hypothetical protein
MEVAKCCCTWSNDEGEIGATKWRSFGRCVSQGLASNGAQENRYGAPLKIE